MMQAYGASLELKNMYYVANHRTIVKETDSRPQEERGEDRENPLKSVSR